MSEPKRRSPLTEALFHGVSVLSAVGLALPFALCAFTAPFAGRAAGLALFAAASLERLWSMYLRQGLGRAHSGAGRDWSAIAVGYAFVLTLALAPVEFLLRRGFPGAACMGAGAAVYIAGVALRYWAFSVLRHQWNVDVSDIGGPRHLVRAGPYRLLRHPLYLGACLEAVGLPVFFGAWSALAVGVLVFAPLEIARAYYEERFLFELFGAEYARYRSEVWGFVPLPFRPGKGR